MNDFKFYLPFKISILLFKKKRYVYFLSMKLFLNVYTFLDRYSVKK